MLPVSLSISGFYSYREKQHIDFEKYTASGLFGIFGSVGSGKSAILEAITIALYNNTERLTKHEKRTYNMMNLMSDRLLVDFVFKNSQDDQLYRFVATAKRNSKRFKETGSFDRSAYVMQEGEWVALPHHDGAKVIGMSYENFRRTVIIPQGRFQEFLQLGDTERRKMMKELFGLEKFDLYNQAKFLLDQTKENLIQLNTQIAGLEDVNEDSIKSHEEAYREVTKSLENKREKLDKNQKALEESKALQSLATEKVTLLKKQAELLEQEKEMAQKKVLIAKLENYFRYIVPLLSRKEELQKEQIETENTHQQTDKELARYSQQFESLRKNINTLQPYYDQKNRTESEIRDLERIAAALTEKIKIEKYKASSERGKTKIEDSKIAILAKEKTLQAIDLKIKTLKESQADPIILSEIKSWHEKSANLEKQIKERRTEVQSQKESTDSLIKAFYEKAKKAGLKVESFETEALEQAVVNAKKQAEDRKEQLQQDAKKHEIHLSLEKFAEELKAGEACPLCGSTEHPDSMKAGDHAEAFVKLNEAIDDQRKHILNLDKLHNELLELKGSLSNQQINHAEKQVKALASELEKHKSAYRWELLKGESIEVVENKLKEAQKASEELRLVESKREALQAEIDSQRKVFDEDRESLRKLEIQQSGIESSIETQIRNLEHLSFEDFKSMKPEEVNRVRAEKEKTYTEKIQNYEQAKEKYEKLIPEIEQLKERLNNLSSRIAILAKNLKSHQEKLSETMAERGFAGEEALKSFSGMEDDLPELKRAVEEWREATLNVKSRLDANIEQSAGRMFDENLHEALEKTNRTLKTELQELSEKSGYLNKHISSLKSKLELKQKLLAELEQLNERHENLRVIRSMLMSGGFVDYVSTIYLKNLCEIANERFHRLTRQSLKLELDENNNFIIRDYLNEGRTRNVKTLSGGQTFQASLSLALALAEHVQQINKSEHNFFFLDEGFGSLDESALSVVFDTLKSLRRENRIVGIISHVEALQQEIDVCIRIKNTEEKGSLIG